MNKLSTLLKNSIHSFIIKLGLFLFKFINRPISAILLVSILILLVAWQNMAFQHDDNRWYIAMAEGRYHDTIYPFSNRLFYPYIVRGITYIYYVSYDDAFFILNTIAIIAMVSFVTIIIYSSISLPILSLPLLFTPFIVILYKAIYLPDLFYSAMFCFFVILVMYNRLLCALVVMFFLFITRESTLLLGVILVILSLYRSQKRLFVGTIISIIISMTFIHLFGPFGRPNIHSANNIIYLLLKIPNNFLKNVAGIILWFNTSALSPIYSYYFPDQPLFVVKLPSWLAIGSVNMLGIYSINLKYPLKTLCDTLTIFGIAPIVLIYDLLKYPKCPPVKQYFDNYHDYYRSFFKKSPLWLPIVMLYGILSFLLGPLLGGDVLRLIGHGWPAFWIAIPYLVFSHYNLDRAASLRLASYHFIICWMPWWMGPINVATPCFAFKITIIYFVITLSNYLALKELKDFHFNQNI